MLQIRQTYFMSHNDTEAELTVAPEHILDARGLYCPEPVMMLHNKIREIEEGEVLELRATDPSTTRDVPKFCVFLGHELIKDDRNDDLYVYWIRKKSDE
jgi:tRNA 2-thiouridine synthesizing protein A